MIVRELSESDIDKIIDLFNSRNTFLGLTQDAIEAHCALSVANIMDLLKTRLIMGRAFGNFDDENGEKLNGVIITLVSSAQPCWFLNKAHARPGSSLKVLPQLFTHAVQFYEEAGYKRFYCMYKKEIHDTYSKLWIIPSLMKSYISYTDMTVEPLERPKHSDFWELLMGRQLYQVPMIIRGFIKRDEDTQMNVRGD